jgi:hypothetical protein
MPVNSSAKRRKLIKRIDRTFIGADYISRGDPSRQNSQQMMAGDGRLYLPYLFLISGKK